VHCSDTQSSRILTFIILHLAVVHNIHFGGLQSRYRITHVGMTGWIDRVSHSYIDTVSAISGSIISIEVHGCRSYSQSNILYLLSQL
jgi:hypothetical protein